MEELTRLIERTRSGDRNAYNGIVRRFQDMAVGYAYALLGDFHLAEDAAQEAFVGAYLDLSDLREPAAFPGWFRRIIFTRCHSMTRGKRIPTTAVEDAGQIVADDLDPAGIIEKKEMEDRVFAAIQSLPDRQREVVTLFYMNELSHNEIASFLEIPLTTVNSRLYQSRKRLEKELIHVARENLQMHKPSKNTVFAEKIDSHLKAMESLHQEYTSLLSEALTIYLHRKTEVEIESVSSSDLPGFVASLPTPCCVFTFLVQQDDDPNGVKTPVAIDLDMSIAAVVAGRDKPPESIVVIDGWDKTWTHDERDRLSNLAYLMLDGIERILNTRVSDAESETNPNYVSFAGYTKDKDALDVPPEDPTVTICLKATAGDLSGRITLCYPIPTLEAVARGNGKAKAA
jgi:RNA polymerase sigma factor (sigma-70 family)